MLPPFIEGLPALDIPFPDHVVSARAVRSDHALVVFFTFHEEVELPTHSHGPQWGTLVQGQVTITIDGIKAVKRPGETWDIPDGAPHSVHIAAGSVVIDAFAEPDRYPLRDAGGDD